MRSSYSVGPALLLFALFCTPAISADPASVRLRPASELLLSSSASAAASVLSPNDATLAAEVAAAVKRVVVDVGTRVDRGALLVELDCTDIRLALAQAQAQTEAAKARVRLAGQRMQRAEQLAEKNYISADELLAISTEQQAAQADVQVVEAQRAIAARQVEKCRVTAPFDAVVMARQAQVGALATPGTPLLRVVDVSDSEVEARLPEGDARSIAGARQIEFETQGRRYPLQLARISEVIEPSTRSRIVRFRFVAESADAGSSGSVHWQAAGGRLPADLLVQRDGALGVFVADNGIARFVAVPGAQPGRPADVTQAPGETIVVEGQQALHDGMPIAAQE